MVPVDKSWKDKRIEKERDVDGDPEDKQELPSDMDVNMVFELPAEFRVPEEEVAELVLGPKTTVFRKPEKVGEHLKLLFIKGHIDG